MKEVIELAIIPMFITIGIYASKSIFNTLIMGLKEVKIKKIELENEKALELVRLENEKFMNIEKTNTDLVKAKYEYDLGVKTLLNEDQKNILSAWMNIHNNTILSNGSKADMNERIYLFIKPQTSGNTTIKNKKINASFELGLAELIYQTILYTRTPEVHYLVERMILESNLNFEKKIINHQQRNMAFTCLIFYYLNLEWKGEVAIGGVEIDSMLKVTLRDYMHENDEAQKSRSIIINEIENIKKEMMHAISNNMIINGVVC